MSLMRFLFGIIYFFIFALPVRASSFLIEDNYLSFAPNMIVSEVESVVEVIEINHSYHLDLSEHENELLSFSYRIESNEHLEAFDWPAFYIVVSNELIFSGQNKDGEWQEVEINLSDLSADELIFYVGNLGDLENKTRVLIKDLLWQESDGFKTEKLLIDNLFLEKDDSLSLLFTLPDEAIEHNWQYYLFCDAEQELKSSFYLLSDLEIASFWPNYDDQVLVNLKNHACQNFEQLILERRG